MKGLSLDTQHDTLNLTYIVAPGERNNMYILIVITWAIHGPQTTPALNQIGHSMSALTALFKRWRALIRASTLSKIG